MKLIYKLPVILVVIYLILYLLSMFLYIDSTLFYTFELITLFSLPFVISVLGLWALIDGIILLKKNEHNLFTFLNLAFGIIGILAICIALYSFMPQIRILPLAPTFDGNINFNIGGAAGNVTLKVGTETIQPCINYNFENSVNIKNNDINVILGDAKRPDICLTAVGPAVFKKELKLKEGDYTLEFQSAYKTDIYSLKVFNDRVEVKAIESNFSKYASIDDVYDIHRLF